MTLPESFVPEEEEPQPQPVTAQPYLSAPPPQAKAIGSFAPKIQPWKAAPPSSDDHAFDAVVAAFDRYGQDPAFANDLTRRWWATLSAPEVVASLRSSVGGFDVPELDYSDAVLESLYGDVTDVVDQELVDFVLESRPLVAEWFTRRGPEFREGEKDLLIFALAGIEGKHRDRVVALAEQYLAATPLTTEDDRTKFAVWFYEQARGQKSEMQFNRTGIGRLGGVVAAPFHAATGAIKGAYLDLVATPEEYKWRKPLSFGQNLALTFGVDPTDEMAWQLTSGGVDLFANFAFDLVNLAVGLGVGNKLTRTVPAIGRLENASRLARVAHSVVPWHGRHVTNLPQFSRGMYTRLGWALRSKTVDEILEGGMKSGVYRDIATVVRGGGGMAEIVERYPELRNTMSGLGQLMTGPKVLEGTLDDAAAYVKEVFRGGFYGTMENGGAQRLLTLAEQDLKAASIARDRFVEQSMAEGLIDPKTLSGVEEGIDTHVRGGAAVYEVRVGGSGETHRIADWSGRPSLVGSVLKVRGEDSPQGAYVVLRGGGQPSTLDLADQGGLSHLRHWLTAHPGRLSDAESVADRLIGHIDDLVDEYGLVPELSLMLHARLAGDDEAMRLLFRYADSRNIDIIGTVDSGFLTPRGANRAMRGIDTPESASALDVLRGHKFRIMAARRRVDELRSGGGRTWFIKDFPTDPPKMQFVKGAWRNHGTSASPSGVDGWWRNARRNASTFFFNPKNPGLVEITNAEVGARSLSTFLRRLGVDRGFINDWVNKFVKAVPEERYDLIRDSIEAAAEKLDHPLLAYGIIEQIRSQGLRAFAFDENGMEVLVAAGRAKRGGTTVALPIMPSQRTMFVQLPGQEVFTALRRYQKASKNPKALPSIHRGFVRGAGRTAKRRKTLVDSYRRIVADATKQDMSQIDDDMLAAMAYATTRPYRRIDPMTGKLEKRLKSSEWVDGLGVFAHLGMANNRLYSKYHSAFSLMQLFGRPISWAARVLLEEQWRAALFDMPSFFRNPARQLGAWSDTWLTSRHVAWQRKQIQFTRQTVANIFDPLPRTATIDDALRAVKRVVPEFEALAAKSLPTSIPELRTLVGRVLQKQMIQNGNMAILDPKVSPARLARLRSRKIGLSESRMEKIGMEKTFSWDGYPEIRNKGFTQLLIEEAAAGTFPVEWAVGRMTTTAVYNYGTAYSRILHQAVHDPVMGKFGLGRIVEAAGHGAHSQYSAERLLTSEGWLAMRDIARRAADGKGVLARNDLELARWYLREVIDPHARLIFGPLLGTDVDSAARVAAEIMDTRHASFSLGGKNYSFDFDSGNLHWLAHDVRQMAADNRLNDLAPFPRKLAAFFEARFLGEDSKLVRQPWTRRLVRGVMATAGDSFSQWVNRRPAWIAAYRDHYRHYRAAGFTEKAARIAAETKATELVNYVFYSLDNVVPFLRKANKTVPFFSAQWEVAQTWGYKIPMMSSWGVGYANMVRKVDRIIEAFIKTGIVEVGEEDPRSPVGTRQLRLNVGSSPNTGNPFGDLLSRSAYRAWRTPAIGVSHFVNIFNWGNDKSDGDNDTWRDKGTLLLSLGMPTDPFSHGLGAVNQAFVGTNPLLGRVASRFLEALPDSVDYQKVSTESGDTIASVVERLDVNLGEFLAENSAVLLENLPAETVNRLNGRQLAPENVKLPAGIVFKIPKTNFWTTMMENVLLPFGRIESDSGPIWNMQPGWFQHFVRGFGLWSGGAGTDKGAAYPGGEVVKGFIDALQPPLSRASVSAEIITQIQHLEASERLLTRVMLQEQKVQHLREAAKGQLVEEVLADGTIRIVNDDNPLAAEIQEEQAIAQALSDELLHRATSNASGALMMRGLMGFYSPGIPQMVYEQNRELAAYYYGRDYAEARKREGVEALLDMPMPSLSINGEDNYEAFLGLMQGWLDDPTGDQNRRFLYENFPELWVFTFGKTYWGPGGEPPEITDFDENARQIKEGLRLPYDPVVFMQRALRTQLRMEMEIDIRNRWGVEGSQQATNILTDWAAYSEFKKEYDIKRAALDEADDLYFDGEYGEFLSRNEDDNFTLLSYLNDWVNNVGEVLDELGDPSSNVLGMFDGQERRQFAGQLREVARSLRSAVYDWRRDFGPQFEPNERDRILSAYFSGPIASYYEGLGDLYDAADKATDSEERSRIFEQIRQFENTAGLAKARIEGLTLPSPLEWRWASLDEESRGEQRTRWVAARPDWLSLWATTQLASAYPSLREYLPTSRADFELYEQYGEMQVLLADMVEPGPNGEPPELTVGQRNEASAAIKIWLEAELVAQGRSGEAAWAKMSPVQRLSLAGALPPSLEEFVPLVNATMDALEVMEKSPNSMEGRILFANLLGTIQERSVFRPQIIQDFENLGWLLYEDRAHDSLIMKLFAGETFDASEL